MFFVAIGTYYATCAVLALYFVVRGEKEWQDSLSAVAYFGVFYLLGLTVVRLVAESVCENLPALCLP